MGICAKFYSIRALYSQNGAQKSAGKEVFRFKAARSFL